MTRQPKTALTRARLRAMVRRAAIRMAMRWSVRSVRIEDGALVVLTLPARVSFAERCEIGTAFGRAIGALPARNVSIMMLLHEARLVECPPPRRTT